MEQIKSMPVLERPREKLQSNGAKTLSDQELIAILLGSGTPKVPLHHICASLLQEYELKEVAGMGIKTLCTVKGIGLAKAAVILAAAEFSRRLQFNGQLLNDEKACCEFLRPILEKETQLQYILLLISARRELLAFAAAGSVLPDMGWIIRLAVEAGAARILLGRNGWTSFSNAERRYLAELGAACAALNVVCAGLMAVGPEGFKMI